MYTNEIFGILIMYNTIVCQWPMYPRSSYGRRDFSLVPLFIHFMLFIAARRCTQSLLNW
jgi:hypothetical protein